MNATDSDLNGWLGVLLSSLACVFGGKFFSEICMVHKLTFLYI